MPVFTDQMGRSVEIPENPGRIISLVPSQTELLFSLGLEEKVVGITKFCIYPPQWRKDKVVIGGTKNFHLDKIRELRPSLIIGNKEENYREGIEALEKEFPVWLSDIASLEGALEMIVSVGIITGKGAKAEEIARQIKASFQLLKPLQPLRGLYFIWRDPYMSVGRNTFINEMLHRLGIINVAAEQGRYPVISKEEIQQLDARIVLLSSEPYPFKEQHMTEIKNLSPEAEVILVDGEMFSWYGSRLCYAVPYFKHLQEEISLRLKL